MHAPSDSTSASHRRGAHLAGAVEEDGGRAAAGGEPELAVPGELDGHRRTGVGVAHFASVVPSVSGRPPGTRSSDGARRIDSGMTVTGRDIIEELVERMRTESEPLRYSALAHGVYRVFLHREDYDRVSPARRALVEEASRALDEELDRLNARRTPAPDQWGKIVQAATRLMKPAEPPLRRPPAGWVIELYPDEDEELLPGHIRITSELGQPPAQAILAGRSDPPRPAARRLGVDADRPAQARAGSPRPVARPRPARGSARGPARGGSRQLHSRAPVRRRRRTRRGGRRRPSTPARRRRGCRPPPRGAS